MLLVEVETPVLEQVYDFKIMQKEKVEKVIAAILFQICQKEDLVLEEGENILLWDKEQGKILPKDWTMEECGIKTGTRLLLM